MKVALLLSGGVDSSVALLRLLEAGHEVTAFYLKIWLEDELAFLGECPWDEDLRFARAVCDELLVPLEIVPLQREYHERVVRSAIDELQRGGTPSPDIWCNRRVKFGAFFDALASLGRPTDFDRIASGHYARIAPGPDGPRLLSGVDPVKDQTYFLYRLDQEQLGRCLFPLGDLDKSAVRALARRAGLSNQDRRDSQGICFLGKLRFEDFVRGYLGEQPGPIRDHADGRALGEHRGLWFHTVGQRKGLGLGGGPWYVVDKDPDTTTLWVCHGDALDQHRRRRFHLDQVHWIGDPEGTEGISVRVRHGPKKTDAQVHARPDGGLDVELAEADPGIAGGQSAVLYRGERCLGGGVIAPPSNS